MLWIEYGPVTSHLRGDNRKELKEAYLVLDKALSVWVEGAIFSAKYQLGVWDGCQHFFKPESGKFQSGLLSAVVRQLIAEDLYVEIQGYPEACPDYESLTRIELMDSKTDMIVMDHADPVRGYQLEAVIQVLKWHRGILKLATNGGKTEVAAAIMQYLKTPSTIFMVPSRELLHQTAERLEERLGVNVGKVGDNVYKPNPDGITVCMYQTLHKHFDAATKRWFAKVKLLFGDECHLAMADTYQKCLRRIPAEYRVGLSGTPFDKNYGNRLTITGYFGPLLKVVSNLELMDKGISVAPSVLLLEPQISKSEAITLDLADYDVATMNCNSRNRLIAELAQGFVKSGRQTMVMVNRVAHAKMLHALIPNSVVVTGRTSHKYRDRAKEGLAQGVGFCCITTVFSTGLSVDYIEAMIMASGGKSATLLLQRVGRSVRTAANMQKDLWIVDFFDHYNKYTRAHSRIRRKIYTQEKFKITEKFADAPQELLDFVNPGLVHHKHLQRPLAL